MHWGYRDKSLDEFTPCLENLQHEMCWDRYTQVARRPEQKPPEQPGEPGKASWRWCCLGWIPTNRRDFLRSKWYDTIFTEEDTNIQRKGRTCPECRRVYVRIEADLKSNPITVVPQSHTSLYILILTFESRFLYTFFFSFESRFLMICIITGSVFFSPSKLQAFWGCRPHLIVYHFNLSAWHTAYNTAHN